MLGASLIGVPFFFNLPIIIEVPWRLPMPITADPAILAGHGAMMAELAFQLAGGCMVMLFGIALLVVPPLGLGSLRAIPWKLRTEGPTAPMAPSPTEDGIEPA